MRLFCLTLLVAVSALAAPILAEDAKSHPRVVGKILKVDIMIQVSEPPNLLVTAVGEVPSGGYENVRLVRAVYKKPPEDGIQDYFLLATPPSGPSTSVISQVSDTDTWKAFTKEAKWVKGVRVHGVGEGVMVMMLNRGK